MSSRFRGFQGGAIPTDRLFGLAALPVAKAEHAARFAVELRRRGGDAELRERVLDEPHLLVSDPEIVVRPEVAHVDRGLHVLFEGLEDLVDRLFASGSAGGSATSGARSVPVLRFQGRRDRGEIVLVEPVPPSADTSTSEGSPSTGPPRSGACFERVERRAVDPAARASAMRFSASIVIPAPSRTSISSRASPGAEAAAAGASSLSSKSELLSSSSSHG